MPHWSLHVLKRPDTRHTQLVTCVRHCPRRVAVAGAALIFCVPSLIFLAAKRADTERKLVASKSEIGGIHLLFGFGVLAAIFGTTITILNTFTDVLA